jgi:hypothetical protein
MKKTDLVLMSVALLVAWWPGSVRAQSLPGAGYPTSAMPDCRPTCPVAASGSASRPSRATAAQPEREQVTITDKKHHGIKYDPADPLATQPIGKVHGEPAQPFTMDFDIPIANLKDKCGAGLQPGSFQIGYDFPGHALSSDPREHLGGYGPNNGVLDSFTVSILPKVTTSTSMPMQATADGVQKLYHPQIPYVATLYPKMGQGSVNTHSARYILPKEAAEYFQAGNTLVLHAEGFNQIYVGVWCSLVPQLIR